MGRKNARESSMQLLFQMEVMEDFSLENLNIFLNNNDYDESEEEYIKKTIETVLENKEGIDQAIDDNLKNWSLDRLANVDLAILRIAAYEILYRDDIPKEVSINEAVEIAKKFSAEDSSKFINGILGGLVKSLSED